VYSAWGFNGQRVIIIPKYNLVTVITALLPDYPGDPGRDLVNSYIIPAIISLDDTSSTTNQNA
jgi:hypothetical protein